MSNSNHETDKFFSLIQYVKKNIGRNSIQYCGHHYQNYWHLRTNTTHDDETAYLTNDV